VVTPSGQTIAYRVPAVTEAGDGNVKSIHGVEVSQPEGTAEASLVANEEPVGWPLPSVARMSTATENPECPDGKQFS
jgi:hypothetical protein